jgi:tetratricopeptide (TPR) repeat protein
MLGNVHFECAEYGEAIRLFDRAYDVAIAGADRLAAASARFNRGNALFRQERYEDALEAYATTRSLLPTHAKAVEAMALTRQRLIDVHYPDPAPQPE